jgi:exonuclease SbcD
MKIAVTADAHLSTGDAHPERYRALEDVFKRTDKAGIEHLIIAGDLFNEDSQNYSEFESICRDHPTVEVHIIPGNHDPDISKNSITGENVHIYTEPEILEIDSLTFLFVPYEKNAKMGDKIAQLEHEIDGKKWVLVGHGDFYGGEKELSHPEESGTYMPLSRKDLRRFKPRTVFLGHIHKPHSPANDVYYVGSPCGLHISERGPRKFLVYDTTDGSIERSTIETDVLYFKETFLVLPREDEVPLLEQEIAKRIKSWNINTSDHSKVQVRVEANGYAKDRSAVHEALERGFVGFAYYKDERPTIENLSVSSDDQLEAISERTMKLIDDLEWSFGGDEPTREQVELAALSVIYGN